MSRPESNRFPQIRACIVLAVAVLALSTSVLMLRESSLPPATLSCYRLFLAVILLLPALGSDFCRHRSYFAWSGLASCVIPGALLALHFMTWVAGARSTEVANASLIVNMVPAVLPLMLWVLLRERVGRREIIGTGIAFMGVAVLCGADFSINEATARGDLMCFGSMFLLAAYMAFGRRNARMLPGVWLYVVPLYFVAAMVCLSLVLINGDPLVIPVGKELALVFGLAIGPTILGHALINYALRHLPGQRVAVASQCQFVFAGLLELTVNGRIPLWGFYVAAPLVLAGAWIVITAPSRAD